MVEELSFIGTFTKTHAGGSDTAMRNASRDFSFARRKICAAGLGCHTLLTCTGVLSRNRKTGIELARGKTLAEISKKDKKLIEKIYK